MDGYGVLGTVAYPYIEDRRVAVERSRLGLATLTATPFTVRGVYRTRAISSTAALLVVVIGRDSALAVLYSDSGAGELGASEGVAGCGASSLVDSTSEGSYRASLPSVSSITLPGVDSSLVARSRALSRESSIGRLSSSSSPYLGKGILSRLSIRSIT